MIDDYKDISTNQNLSNSSNFSLEHNNILGPEPLVPITRIGGLSEFANCIAVNQEPVGSDPTKRFVFLGSQKHSKVQSSGEVKIVAGQLTIFDISTPDSAKQIASLNMDIKDMQLWGQWLIVASICGLISIIDIGDPYHPRKLMDYQYASRINKLHLERTYHEDSIPTLFIQSYDRGYSQVDLFALPNNLRIGENIFISSIASAMTSIDFQSYTTEQRKRFFYYSEGQKLRTATVNAKKQTFDIQGRGEILFSENICSMVACAQSLIVGTKNGDLYSVGYSLADGSGYLDSKLLSANVLHYDSAITDIQIIGRNAFVATIDGVHLVDISNPERFIDLTAIMTKHPLVTIKVVDNLLLIKDTQGLSLYKLQLV